MATLTEPGEPRSSSFPEVVAERRRPGRPETVHPNLISLLRHPATLESAETALVPPLHDDLRPATGIVVGIALSAPFWALLAYFVL